MKYRLLDFLACPDCKGELLKVECCDPKSGNDLSELEIRKGFINCQSCDRQYPIIDGIPRMLPHALLKFLRDSFNNFFDEYPNFCLRPDSAEEVWEQDIIDTLKGYTYQHVQLKDPISQVASPRTERNFIEHCLIPKSFLSGKTGLDVGCGEGRHMYYASKYGAEMIGMDLSGGVEVARDNNQDSPNAHFVQGDIYHLPFKKHILDFIYSIGVLHHTPNPKKSFTEIANLLVPNGLISIWVYSLEKNMTFWYKLSHMKRLRAFTAKLSMRMKLALSILIACGFQVFVWFPCACLSRIGSLRKLFDKKAVINNYKRPFKSKVRSVFDRFQPPVTHYITQEEVKQWYREAHLTDIDVKSRGGRGIIAIGKNG